MQPIPPTAAPAATPDASTVTIGAALTVLVVVAVLTLGLWLGRRAIKASGAARERSTRTAAEREEAFMEMTLAMHRAKQRGAAAPGAAGGAAVAAASPSAPAFEGLVFCPACGTALGAAGAMLRFITKCPGCGRRVAARAEGARVSVDVEA